MNLVGITLARTLGFVELIELIPRGTVFYPELMLEIVKRYQFQKFPQKFEEFDQQKGIEFCNGIAENGVIERFTIFTSLLTVETHSSTTTSQKILQEMLEWGKEKFALAYRPEMIRWAYISELVFHTDIPIIAASSEPLEKLARKTGKTVSQIWGEDVVYEPLLLGAGHDVLKRKYAIAPISIAYFRDHPFEENTYFSSAPLPTETHIKFLEEFEADVLALLKK